MRNIKRTFWGLLALTTLLWVAADERIFHAASFFARRAQLMQYTGIIAIGAMSVAMILALRPRWPEHWFGGLDKMYRLHKWLGIGALVVSIIHWLWSEAPKWAVAGGLLARPHRGPRPPIDNQVQAFFSSFRGTAEGVGEWAFYAAVILIVLALIKWFPYRLFYKTHQLLAVVYLVLVFHSVVLMRFSYWASPIGWMMALLMVGGTWAAVVVLLRRVGAGRQVQGEIASLQYYPGVHALEIEIDVPRGWPGHKPGQFAFATSDVSEGAHPYTIASSWRDDIRRITFITKELGDHTRELRNKLRVGQKVKVEGPYGCFTFDDRPIQIWVGGGIGITPFIARMKELSQKQGDTGGRARPQSIHLFHTTSDVDETAFEKLAADARSANIELHLLVDVKHGLLTGKRIREAVPEWREASIWFCGPAGFGAALRKDFAEHGLDGTERFHQELFDMR